METLFEAFGRKQLAFEQLDKEYTKLLALLADVVSGSIDRRRVLVNLTDRTWTLAEEGQRPGLPATINGVPQCVVCPDE